MSALKEYFYNRVSSSTLSEFIKIGHEKSNTPLVISASITKKQALELQSYNIDAVLQMIQAMGDELVYKIKSAVMTKLTEDTHETHEPFDIKYLHAPTCICNHQIANLIQDNLPVDLCEPTMENNSDLYHAGDIIYKDEDNRPLYIDIHMSWDNNTLINYDENISSVEFHINKITNEGILDMNIEDMPDVIQIELEGTLDIKMDKPCVSYKFEN